MTKEEFFKEHQDNEELIKELDDIISVLKKCDDQIPYFAIHMKQLGKDIYNYQQDATITKHHKDLLSILVDIGIVDKFPSRHKDETSTYKIKTSQKFSKTLINQLHKWKIEQEQKSKPNTVENYTNSNVIKGASIQESDLNFSRTTKSTVNTAPNAHLNQDEDSKIIDIIKKYWWSIIVPIIVGIILLIIEYGWLRIK